MENHEITPDPHQNNSEAVSSHITQEIINLQSEIELFKSKKKEFRCKPIRVFIQSIPYQVVVTIFTLFALFGDDLNTLLFTKDSDFGFDIAQVIVMSTFLLEVLLSSIAINGYLFSFFFWLDLLSSISMLMDINLFTDVVFSIGTSQISSISKVASQSKTSRAAARAVRIIRLIRLLRVVKLYKSAVKANEIKERLKREKLRNKKTKLSSQKVPTRGNVTLENVDQRIESSEPAKTGRVAEVVEVAAEPQEPEVLESKESKVSQILSNANIQKVILVMLLIMFFVPLFDVSTYSDDSTDIDIFARNLKQLLMDPKCDTNDIQSFTDTVIADLKTQKPNLIAFCTPFLELQCFGYDLLSSYRSDDTIGSQEPLEASIVMSFRSLRLNPNNQSSSAISAVTSRKSINDINAWDFSLGRILFVCLVLATLLHFFTKDTDDLILVPIEGMIDRVKQMANNPTAMESQLVEQTEYETGIVHNAILKIGNMLSLVYGSAGAEIIGTNMMKGGDMNPLTGGKKMCAIFGFCDIRNFTDATEVLQENIMIFVNQIGEIVHSAVYRYGGSANKNIGDAFLLVWKMPKDKYEIDKHDKVHWLHERYANILCDFSLLSFIKIIVKINKDPKILQYRHDQKLLARLGPTYQVRMGFGLHIGWAIEGAIGSQYKIDASYLSPNVNMASRLQAATKQYDVPILISSALYDNLTAEMKAFCRNIDRVTVKGSNQPIGLYTVDLDINNISPPSDKTKKYATPEEVPDIELKKQINMEFLNEAIDEYDAYTFIENKKELREVLMINVHLQEFRMDFENGFENYLSGDWSSSLTYLSKALLLKPGDGPCRRLMSFMQDNIVNGSAPPSWKNYRELTEK